MKSRMDRYARDNSDAYRTKKNETLYEEIYEKTLPSSNVALLDNESEIDITKLQDLIKQRDGYKRIKEFEEVLLKPELPKEEEEYDIYEDIDNKIYDINAILEEARSKREPNSREKYRNLKNTQYNILSNLNFDEEDYEEEMDTDFFTKDKTMRELMTELNEKTTKITNKTRENTKTSLDLFDNLKGNGDTVLTKPIKSDDVKPQSEETFYTNALSFTKDDFEDFQNLQKTVNKNNTLMKFLISILVVVLIIVVLFLVLTIL